MQREARREASSILIKKVAYQIPLPHRADADRQSKSTMGYSPINEEGHNREHHQNRAQDDAEDSVAGQRCNHTEMPSDQLQNHVRRPNFYERPFILLTRAFGKFYRKHTVFTLAGFIFSQYIESLQTFGLEQKLL